MSLLLEAEKLSRAIAKAEAKRDKKIEAARQDCHDAIVELKNAASSEVLCLLESAQNLSPISKAAAE